MRIRHGLVAAGACVVLLAGCGTRASDSEIQAGAGGGPVTLPDSVLAQLRDAVPAAAPAAGAAAPTGGVAAPTGGVAVDSGTTSSGTTAGSAAGTAPSTAVKGGANPSPTAATGPGKPVTSATSGPACTTKGAPVNIGQVGTFSGVTGPAWAGGRISLAVWARDLNARGGLACHPVNLQFADDGGDPARAAALVQELVRTRGVVAFVGAHLSLSMSGFKQAVENAKVPAIGGDLIAPEWYRSPYLFPQGAGIEDQIYGFLKQSVLAGKTKLGLLYCVEISACGYANKLVNQDGLAKAAGATVVYSSAISLTQTDFTAQCQSAKNAGVDQLALGMDGTAMARVARSCSSIGYKPLLGGIGGTISPGQAEDPQLREFNLGTATGTAPWTESSTPGLKAYQDALAQYAPGEKTSGSSVQLWTAGKLLEAGVAKVGASARDAPITAALVLSGLRQIKKETLGGLTGPLTFGPGVPVSSGCVFFELLTTKGWTAPRGSKPFCR